MNDNIFFDVKKLKYIGSNVIIGQTARIRYPELVELHDNTVVDDFVYISTGLILNPNSIIEPGCVLMGGRSNQIILGSFTALAPHCTLLCSSNDFMESVSGMYDSPLQKFHTGPIIIENYSIIGAHTTILPNVTIGEGSRIGAHSLVKNSLAPWGLYAGCPVKKLRDVNKAEILRRANFLQAT